MFSVFLIYSDCNNSHDMAQKSLIHNIIISGGIWVTSHLKRFIRSFLEARETGPGLINMNMKLTWLDQRILKTISKILIFGICSLVSGVFSGFFLLC